MYLCDYLASPADNNDLPPPTPVICGPAGSFKRRKRKSIVVTALLLVVSVLILVFGLAATTRTQNITVGGYYPGVIVSAGSPQGHSPSETVRYVCVCRWGGGAAPHLHGRIIGKGLWWVNFPHIHYSASLSLEAERVSASRLINVFSSPTLSFSRTIPQPSRSEWSLKFIRSEAEISPRDPAPIRLPLKMQLRKGFKCG